MRFIQLRGSGGGGRRLQGEQVEARRDGVAAASGASGSRRAVKRDEAPKLPPVTPKKLAPVINVLGAENVVPTAVVIELATPIIDRAEVGASAASRKLMITPEVAGHADLQRRLGADVHAGAAARVRHEYKVDLQALETRDGVVEPPAKGETWTYSVQDAGVHVPRLGADGARPRAPQGDDGDRVLAARCCRTSRRRRWRSRVDGQAPAGIAVLPQPRPITCCRCRSRIRGIELGSEARARDQGRDQRDRHARAPRGERRVRRQRRQGGRDQDRAGRRGRERLLPRGRVRRQRRAEPGNRVVLRRGGLLQPVAALPARRRRAVAHPLHARGEEGLHHAGPRRVPRSSATSSAARTR